MSASSPTERLHRLLGLTGALADPGHRREALAEIAEALGVEHVAIFVLDPEIGKLLPGRGIRQSWPRAWRDFVAHAGTGRVDRVTLPALSGGSREVSARALSLPDGSAVLILVGGDARQDDLTQLQLMLPLIARLMASELALEVAQAHAAVARQAAAQARSLTDALDASRRALQDEVRTREEFLAAASHDLKNPLGVVKGVAQLLRRQLARTGALPPERLTRSLESIEGAVDQMVSQIDELLDLARIQMGQAPELQRSHTDIVELVRRVVSDYQRVTERHQFELETAHDSLIGQWDAARLARVVGNLIGNAIKYSPAGGPIVVELASEQAAEEQRAVLRVRDAGLGIPTTDLPHVFDRFHRAGNVVGRIAGAGLGLAASRQLIEQHAGSIEVSSVEGAGSTFTVRLPLEPPAQPT